MKYLLRIEKGMTAVAIILLSRLLIMAVQDTSLNILFSARIFLIIFVMLMLSYYIGKFLEEMKK